MPHPVIPVPDLPDPAPPMPTPTPTQVEVPPSRPEVPPLPLQVIPSAVSPVAVAPPTIAPIPAVVPPVIAAPAPPKLPVASARLTQDQVEVISQRLNDINNQLEEEHKRGAVVLTVGKAAAAIWVGYVIYALRAGSLLTSLLSVMPLWRTLDPLPIIQAAEARMHRLKRRLESGKDKSAAPDEEELTSLMG
jgi:hypothetical protein